MQDHNATDDTMAVTGVAGVAAGGVTTAPNTTTATVAANATAAATTVATTAVTTLATAAVNHAVVNTTLGTLYNDSGGDSGGMDEDVWLTYEENYTLASINAFAVNATKELAAMAGDNATAPEHLEYCTEWSGATLTLFQVANFFCLLAFIVPHNFRVSALLMRSVLCVGILLFALWAALDICAPDILAWNVGFLVVNSAHVLHLTYTMWPPRVPNNLAELYGKVFKPLKVNRHHFSALVREATLLWLDPGDAYAKEDVTAADERLSILISGKLRVSCDNTHLHDILPTQFIDSPEWESCPDDSDELFQVSIVAEERSEYLCWSRPRLRHVLNLRPFLRAILHCLIGKDITTKLYSQHEQLGVDVSALDSLGGGVGRSGGVMPGGAEDVWRGVVERSLSVDNVHTGTKGLVRSVAWRSSHATRTTATNAAATTMASHGAAICDSVRWSPGRPHDPHASAPALEDAAWGGARPPATPAHRLVTHTPGLHPPPAGVSAAGGDGSSSAAIGTRAASGVGGKRTSRENVVRFLGIPDA